MDRAIQFLTDPKVKLSTVETRVDFLKRKGMSDEDILGAARTAGDRGVAKHILSANQGLRDVADGEAKKQVTIPDRLITVDELAAMDGQGGRPLCLSCKGIVYEVDPSFYGKGEAYHAFAAKDCTRHLAKVSVGDSESNRTWGDLSAAQVEVLNDWEEKYQAKYPILGRLDTSQLQPPDAEEPMKPSKASKAGSSGCAQQ
ncbi:putative steroid-binding protein 3 [Diplonema papillatum]|nr:putative steroid-binding protein 3 [Diplonema papillatum]